MLTRIALCQSYLGEIDGARASLEKAGELVGETNQLAQIWQSLGDLSSGKSTSIVNASWEMRLGNPEQ